MDKWPILLLICLLYLQNVDCRKKSKTMKPNVAKHVKYNSDYGYDREKDQINKPVMPEHWVNKVEYSDVLMDFCDPRHCGAYHKVACGLNRKALRFKWFQSRCHIILNNKCVYDTKNMKYDIVDTKFCRTYITNVRSSCKETCTDETLAPVCGMSTVDQHLVLFKNRCKMFADNCLDESFDEYDEIDLRVCYQHLKWMKKKRSSLL